jgi:hypothetical protein
LFRGAARRGGRADRPTDAAPKSLR